MGSPSDSSFQYHVNTKYSCIIQRTCKIIILTEMTTIEKSAVLFDLDGVTIDTEPLYTLSEIRLFKEYGIEIPREDWSLFRGCSEKTFFDLICMIK